MRKLYAICFPLFFCCSCGSQSNSHANIIQAEPSISYIDFKKQVDINRHQLRNASSKKIGDYLFSLLNNDIARYWSGTPWDFNGTTRAPQTGNIACGYFVTNTLADIGFNIQRVKLAQVASSEMIKTLCVQVKTISGFDHFKEYIKTLPAKSVLIVGLDFHTGYILKDDSEAFFLHSNYIQKSGVVKEYIEDSKALANSKVYVVGSISDNKLLLQNWVNH